MKFEELKKIKGAELIELTDEQLENAAGGFYIGANERVEYDGVYYRGCPGCGEARPWGSKEPCPVCGA